MQRKTLKIHPDDNLEVALTDLQQGTVVTCDGKEITLVDTIPGKHKFALKNFAPGDAITMFGVLVGKAVVDIPAGSLISTKNITHASDSYRLGERRISWQVPNVNEWRKKTFMGHHRTDGSVGTANYWLVIPLVFCENKNVDVMQEAFSKALGYAPAKSPYEAYVEKLIERHGNGQTQAFASDQQTETLFEEEAPRQQKIFPNVDGIKFLNHTLGCGGTRQDARALCGLLAGYITHSNVAGATVLSLGCQNAQISILQEEITKRDPSFSKPIYILEQQQIGNEKKMLQQAISQTF
ncbi:MAG: altronate dehydratase, partial [Chitinophagaceae bacterium]